MRQITSEKNARNAGRRAAASAGQLRRHRETVIRAEWEPGLTAFRLSKRTGLSPDTVRTFCRRLELSLETEQHTPAQSPYRDVVSGLAAKLVSRPWTVEGLQ